MNRFPLHPLQLGGILAAAFLVACADMPTDIVPLLSVTEDCDEVDVDDISECEGDILPPPPGSGDYAGFLQSDRNDLRTWAAAGDPYPGTAGVWLGSAGDPAYCFLTSHNESIDGDRDLLRDSCEFVLARAFAPLLQFHPDETCAAGEPYWGATPHINNVVTIGYLLAYYKDCGGPISPLIVGHNGDSEYAQITVGVSTNTGHWYVKQLITNAHTTSSLSGATSLTYPVLYKAFPQLWVAHDKHATYPSDDCQILGGGSGWVDSCSNNTYWRFRLKIRSHRNIGAPNEGGYQNALPCQGSLSIAGTRKECFFSEDRPFNGWQPSGSGVTSYYRILAEHFFSYGPKLMWHPTGGEDCEDEPGLETDECMDENY
jgi:hypothetical protein